MVVVAKHTFLLVIVVILGFGELSLLVFFFSKTIEGSTTPTKTPWVPRQITATPTSAQSAGSEEEEKNRRRTFLVRQHFILNHSRGSSLISRSLQNANKHNVFSVLLIICAMESIQGYFSTDTILSCLYLIKFLFIIKQRLIANVK